MKIGFMQMNLAFLEFLSALNTLNPFPKSLHNRQNLQISAKRFPLYPPLTIREFLAAL
jgi:membrane-anchored protein YejM (alkaline phosphatase superfamily)